MKKYNFLVSGRCYETEEDIKNGGKWFRCFETTNKRYLNGKDISKLERKLEELENEYKIIITNVVFLNSEWNFPFLENVKNIFNYAGVAKGKR